MHGVILFASGLTWLLVTLATVNGQNSYLKALKSSVVSHQQQDKQTSQTSRAQYRVNGNQQSYGRQGHDRSGSDCSQNYHADYLKLALQWGPGFCATSPRRCVRGDNRLFTIHGMWSQIEGKQSPSSCCFENQLNYKNIEHLIPMLEKYWFSYFSRDSRGFWSHGWVKHGTCMRDINKLHGVSQYFGATLNIMKRMDILATLKKNGIVPGSNKVYSSQAVINGVRELTGGKLVQVDCDLEAHQPTPLLTGMNLCFDTDLNFIDCPPSKSRCRRNVMFINQ